MFEFGDVVLINVLACPMDIVHEDKIKKSLKLPSSKPNTQINRQTKNLINLRKENFANKQFSGSK